ncbi:hypothetical protein E4U55_000539 [Claviceps digitariae]|nr:hypothetical protein E4U55_000539 [Claviceps digitariae]
MASIKRFAVLALLSVQVSKAAALDSPLPGYGIHTFEWNVELFPGQTHNFSGTVEQVQSQIRKLNPRWTPSPASADQNGSSVVDRRDDEEGQLIHWREINCGETQGWESVNVGADTAIGDGIKRLREVANAGGVPKAGPGPGLCGRVSCSYDTAIWWCNDSRNEKALASWLNIADGAWQIVRRCLRDKTAKGQVFTDADWNVIVRRDRQDC